MKLKLAVIAALMIALTMSAIAKDLDLSGKVLTIKKLITTEVKTDTTNKKVIDFTFDYNGKECKFSDITKNKVVFLNFWGTWCGPCRNEIPSIIEIQKELGTKDFIVIGMACERSEQEINKVVSFVSAQGINYVNFMRTKEIADYYGGIKFIPTTFLINKNGTIIDQKVGGNSKETFMTWIKTVLK
jgi:thiol-disulfide isomerase/thioredoxin